jgi:hypothetical protein
MEEGVKTAKPPEISPFHCIQETGEKAHHHLTCIIGNVTSDKKHHRESKSGERN